MTVLPHPMHTPQSNAAITHLIDDLDQARFEEMRAAAARRKAHHRTMLRVRDLRAAGHSYTWLAARLEYPSRQALRQAYERWEEVERRKRAALVAQTTTSDGGQQ